MKIMTDPALDQRLRVEAARQGASSAALVNQLLDEHLPPAKPEGQPAEPEATASTTT